jgi:hypothetical protein
MFPSVYSFDWTRHRHIDIYSQLLPQPLVMTPLNVVLGVVMSLQVFAWMATSPHGRSRIPRHRYVY